MRTRSTSYVHQGLRTLGRNPMLTTVVMFSIACGVAALMAFFSVWRAASACPVEHTSQRLYVAQAVQVISTGVAHVG
jgi:putative ABC transport system permease protein